jgi:RNA polymerase sigma-70 factor (ECF subfamily)
MNGGSGEWEPGGGKRGLWEARPTPWGLEDPAAVFQTREAYFVIEAALEALPGNQRRVVLLRDVEDLDPAEICNMLEISETNQRVLLHRGRARVRRALDAYLQAERPRSATTVTKATSQFGGKEP